MLSIMDNRKRPRYEMIHIDNNNSNDNMQGVANNLGTATLATIGGQSYLLSNSSTPSIPANILLSICDENSDEAEEYILDHSMLTPIKQEQTTIATQTNNNQTTQLQQTNLVNTAAATPQFRLVNQAGKVLNTSSLSSVNPTIINSSELNVNSLNNLNLPPGCEIYVIKEVFDSPPKQIIAESTTSATAVTTATSTKTLSANSNAIKLGQISTFPSTVQRRLLHINNSSTQNLSSNSTSITINTNANINSSNASAITSSPDETTKRSLILDAYKKRDDKRRATHNEVERRRRDKINSWIFKLKEMLPSEHHGTSYSTRTPPSDSKSQILIKACEYIKTMQEEMNSLRECLTENENLRLKNERLQDEINSLRAKQQQQQKLHNNNNNNLLLRTTNSTTNNSNNSSHNSDNSDSCEITLNSLNTTYANVQLFTPSTHHHLVDLVGLTTASNGTTGSSNSVNLKYAKRELIITDYVD